MSGSHQVVFQNIRSFGTAQAQPSLIPTAAVSHSAFSYSAVPGGPRTWLSYISSFGVTNSSQNTGSGSWLNSHDTLAYTASPIAGNNYFTQYNRVRIIDGDGSADGPDWAVLNFGLSNDSGDFDGSSSSNAFFGGESTASGGTGGVGVSTGYIWGFSGSTGWQLLYQLPLGPSSSSWSHENSTWFTAGGDVGSGHGKRSAYDYLAITHVGFSVT